MGNSSLGRKKLLVVLLKIFLYSPGKAIARLFCCDDESNNSVSPSVNCDLNI